MLTIRSLLQVCIVKHQEGAVTAQLKGTLLQAIRADLCNELANTGAASEGHLLHHWMPAERLAERRSVLEGGRQDIEDAFREAGLLGQIR